MAQTCQNAAAYRLAFPDGREYYICEQHGKKIIDVSAAIGIVMQIMELDKSEIRLLKCERKIS